MRKACADGFFLPGYCGMGLCDPACLPFPLGRFYGPCVVAYANANDGGEGKGRDY